MPPRPPPAASQDTRGRLWLRCMQGEGCSGLCVAWLQDLRLRCVPGLSARAAGATARAAGATAPGAQSRLNTTTAYEQHTNDQGAQHSAHTPCPHERRAAGPKDSARGTVFDALSSGNGWLGRGSPSTTAVSTKTGVEESEFDFLPQRGQRVNKTAVYKGREVKIAKAYSGRSRKGRWCALDIEQWSASERRDLIANNPRPAETTAAVTSDAQNTCEI